MIADSMLFCLKFMQINGRILRRNLHFIETKCHAEKMCFPGMAFFMVLIFDFTTIKRQPRPTVLFYPIVFLLFQKRKQPAGKTLPSRLFLLDKTEKTTHFRHFFKKKALHNCIICAVRLCGVQPTPQIIQNPRNYGLFRRTLQMIQFF